MSLYHAAKHLAEQGRGPDDQLIHMSSKEIAGLQSLAKAHGGSLTINPKTGLPEAGFLDNILPAVIGAGAMYFSGGTINPATIGMGVGGFQALRTGDIGKGLMAGLGAYGGAAGLEGLAGLGEAGSGFAGQSMADNVAGGAQMALNNPAAAAQAIGYKPLAAAAAPAVLDMLGTQQKATPAQETGNIRPYEFTAGAQTPKPQISTQYQPGQDTSERLWFQPSYKALPPYKAAAGGLMDLAAGGGPVEQMSNANSIGQNTGYPQADISAHAYATPWQTPISQNMVTDSADTGVNRVTGEMNFAAGGLSDLGSFSDGGRLLRGPGDGVSDSIPAQIAGKQPARLADGEFVVPARIVSELGNGSTEAGARQLYKMMDRVQNARGKTTGKGKMAKNTNAAKYLPA